MVRKKIILAGNLKYVTIQVKTDRKEKRERKKNPTRKSVMEANERLSIKHLGILLGYNYVDGDYHMVLTYKEEPTPEQAKKILRNYIDRLRRLYKKLGLPFKWTVVTEYKNKRLHHHMILNRSDRIAVEKLWKHGIVFFRELYGNRDYRKLAEYLVKETRKTFREDGISKHRFRHGKDVAFPEIKDDLNASPKDLFREPKPTKGYYIDRDSVYQGKNPYTGMPYLEYVEIALDNPSYKIWPRGRRRKYIESYYPMPPDEEEQLKFMMPWEEK